MLLRITVNLLGAFKVMIAMCAGCGIVYALKRGGKGITHGICPNCKVKMRADIAAFRATKEAA